MIDGPREYDGPPARILTYLIQGIILRAQAATARPGWRVSPNLPSIDARLASVLAPPILAVVRQKFKLVL